MAHKFVDMSKDQEELREEALPTPFQNKYPYGLCLSLCDDELEKLELDNDDLEVGVLLHLHAMAKVTSYSESEGPDGESHCRAELQITHLCVDNEDEEDEKEDISRPYF